MSSDSRRDGEEGHFLGDTEPYDAVILDLGLPRWTACAWLQQWRKAGRMMPVLILTRATAGAARSPASTRAPRLSGQAVLHRGIARPHAPRCCAVRGHRHFRIEVGPLQIDTRATASPSTAIRSSLTSLEYRLLAYLASTRARGFAHRAVEHLTIRISTATRITIKCSSPACEEAGGRSHSNGAWPWLLPRRSGGSSPERRIDSIRLPARLILAAAVWAMIVWAAGG